MATKRDLGKWQEGLRSSLPLIGPMLRRKAIQALEQNRDDPQVVPVLIEAARSRLTDVSAPALRALAGVTSQAAIEVLCEEAIMDPVGQAMQTCMESSKRPLSPDQTCVLLLKALDSAHQDVARRGREALMNLTSQPVIDAFCRVWSQRREERLAAIIVERKYVARHPVDLHVLSSLKAGMSISCESLVEVECLVHLLNDQDLDIRHGAEQSLRAVQPGPRQDILCEGAIKDPGGQIAEICIQTGKRPSDPERACLFLFVTNQLDAYFEEDYEFQNLRLQFEKADAGIKAHVMEVLRSGDRRCLPFAMQPRGALTECAEPEIKLAIECCLRHKDYERLLTLCLELPLKYSLPAMEHFRNAGWEPESPELRSLLRQLLIDSEGQTPFVPLLSGATSTVFERWIARGRELRFAQASEGDLVQRLGYVDPPEGVSIVAALAAKGKCCEATVGAIRDSDHWLIRLAGLRTGLTKDLLTEPQKDLNFWVNELASVPDVLEFWPGTATPEDLERLKSAPREAFAGTFGAPRKMLRSIIGYRIGEERGQGRTGSSI